MLGRVLPVMNTFLRSWIPATFLLSITASLALAEAGPAVRVEKRLRELTQGKSSGLAVLVARDGKILFQGGFGFANVEREIAITPQTKFRIGSISKQFTAAAILRLADEKKLQLTDSLATYFPDFPRGKEITLHHLLTHTSGIHSYTEKPDFLLKVNTAVEPAKLIASFQNDPPDFAPGSGFRYNNSAYFLLGEIIARVSGKSFARYLDDAFFQPLEMKDTGVYVNAAPPASHASGYSRGEESLSPALDWDMSWAGGAGALYSTVGDLWRWNEAFQSGRVISAAATRQATTPNPLPPGADGLNYGYGLVISKVHGLPVISHGGGLHGWSSDLLWFPDQRVTVAVLANALPPPSGLAASEVAAKLAEHFLAEDIAKIPPTTTETTVDPERLAEFAGRYDYRGGILTVSVQDGHLFAQLTGQPKHEIFAKGRDTFTWKVVDAEVRFLRNGEGVVTAAQHTQSGGTFRAPKIEGEGLKLTEQQLAGRGREISIRAQCRAHGHCRCWAGIRAAHESAKVPDFSQNALPLRVEGGPCERGISAQ